MHISCTSSVHCGYIISTIYVWEMYMILVIGGIKGGSGKTTLATNLAVLRAENKKVLLIDADEQLSTSLWANQRDCRGIKTNWSTIQLAGKHLHSQIQRMRPDYDDIIIDIGGRDTTSQRSALSIADVYLVPFKPRSLDIWTIGHVKTVISEMKLANPTLKAFAVINQADSKGTDNEEALHVLEECQELKCLTLTIGQRKAFSNAAADGLGIGELKNFDKKAYQEMKDLYDYLYKICTE